VVPYLTVLVWQEGVMLANSAWCRTLSFMDKLAGSAVYSCMLLEGIFLHRLIAAAFKGEPKMMYYYIAAAGKILPRTNLFSSNSLIFNNRALTKKFRAK
jgi:hypothetical protein